MKKGSALLVVLGMIAFMVISAVAFSAYMRYSRLPSSYLLRTSSSRHLAKAALAEAIDIIDASIGNNPHPGVGTTAYQYPRKDGMARQRNHWRNHVFIGTNQLVNAEDTVSTLTMEALAYLPFALINEARYFSRRSSAAIWKTLGFDSGRFAFSAIDVSDHFDVNRLKASVARSSSDRGKISLAHVFENKGHTGYLIEPSVWDAFVSRYYDQDNPYDTSFVPFVSLADLNLAMNFSKLGTIVSPFCRYIESGGGTDFVLSMSGQDSEMMRSMAFVTDSYFPRTSEDKGNAADYSLCEEENQPFKSSDLRSTVKTVMTPYMYSSDGCTRLRESLCGLAKVQLWDYLDEDSVPVSLALPTVERTPMVCAIRTSLSSANLNVRDMFDANSDRSYPNGTPAAPTPNQTRVVQDVHHFRIDGAALTAAFMGGKVEAIVAFPFLRDDDVNQSFEIDGRLSFFFSNPDLSFRTGGNSVLSLGVTPSISSPGVAASGVMNIPFQKKTWKPSGITSEVNALKKFEFDLNSGAAPITAWLAANDIAQITYEWVQTYQETSPGSGVYAWTPTDMPALGQGTVPTIILNANCGLAPLDKNGEVDSNFTGTKFLSMMQNNISVPLCLQSCVWLSVKRNNKFVDLVPACMKDDDDLNGCSSFSSPVGMYLKAVSGDPYPLMKFTSSASFNYSHNDLTGNFGGSGVSVALAPTAVMVADPRYNYAPEHWFMMNGGFSVEHWLNQCQRGQNGRDRDIFMATSDMGYLQSIYELAFLPRLSDMQGPGRNTYYGNMNSISGMSKFADNFADTANNHLAWQTYRCFDIQGAGRDDFEGVGFSSEGNGFRVNPYSESTPIVMAALANTPYNWMVASTNETAPNALSRSDREVGNFNKNYCFNQMGAADTRFDWQDLELVAKQIQNAARGALNGEWKDRFDDLDWAGDNSDLAGADFVGSTVDLYDVDRKFLYGFWKDSFAAKQQLFLVFVRAEPLMMGGGAMGQTPPQLGARAVALVWRDPTISDKLKGENNPPHRTRVLFYRQFD